MAKRVRWTDEKVIEAINRIYESGEQMSPRYINANYGGLYRQAFNRFGSWRNAVELVTGINYDSVLECSLWTKEKILEAITERERLGKSLTAGVVVSESKKLHDAAYKYYGSWRVAVETAGFDYEAVLDEGRARRVISCSKYTPEDVKRIIKHRHETGKPVSSGYMQTKLNGIMHAGVRYFGSWKEAIEAAGIEYAEVNEERVANVAGHYFEDILADILDELQLEYRKYDHDRWRPDFVLNNQHWVDAKLSEWTSSIEPTATKYEPHVRRLTIVYLRGRNAHYNISDKTELISVYRLLDELPKARADYYASLLQDIVEGLRAKSA